MDYDSIKAIMRKMLSQRRYDHSLFVAERAVLLADIHGADKEKAYLAGLVHDICKDLPREEQLKWLKKSDIISDNTIFKQPNVWHGISASVYVKEELGITDEQVIGAVRYHTTGRKDMTKLEKIVYMADLTSKDRKYEGVENLRELAEKDLEASIRDALIFIMGDLAKRKLLIGLDTYLAYNQYMEKYMEN